MEGSSSMTSIPKGLSPSESGVYDKLIRVAEQRKETGQRPRPIVVITDAGLDYDDLAALAVLTEFHRLGFVELRAVVANLMPAEKRARLAMAVLDSLGVRDVPVACGTRGSSEGHKVLKHEFSCCEFAISADIPLQDGQDLLRKVYQNARENGEKLHLLCLSSLQDIHEFASTHSHLVAEWTAEVHMQGGNYISEEGNLEPDIKAANNRFNWEASKAWHSFIQVNALPSHTYTKVAAFAAPLTSDVFVELEATGHPIGAYLRRVQVEQDVAFYEVACESEPKNRFGPFRDQKWFLDNKTNWHLRPCASEGDALPIGKEVVPYLTKIVLYDVHAALGVAGKDVVAELNVFKSRDRTVELAPELQGELVRVHHWITGDEFSTAVPEKISLAMSSLLKGSLLYAVQHKPGTVCNPPCNWGIEQEQACSGRTRPLVADTKLFRKWKETRRCAVQQYRCREVSGMKQTERLMHWDAAVHRFPLIDVKVCVIDGKGDMSYTALSDDQGDLRQMPQITSENRFPQAGSLRSEMLRFRSCLKVL